MKNKIVLLLSAVVIIYALILNGIFHANKNLSAYGKQANTSLDSLPSIFRDKNNETSLALQLTLGRPDTGEFEFFVSNVGYYRGVIPLIQSGGQIIHPQGTVTAKFYPLDDSATTTPATIRMTGEVNTAHSSASIDVWADNTHYHLTTDEGDAAAGKQAAKEVLSFMTSRNWSSLYGILSSEVQSSVTQEQFTQLMSSSNSPTIISAELNGLGKIKILTGNTYFAQDIILTVRQTNGSTAIFHSTEYFVLEKGKWRLLTTNTPTP